MCETLRLRSTNRFPYAPHGIGQIVKHELGLEPEHAIAETLKLRYASGVCLQ